MNQSQLTTLDASDALSVTKCGNSNGRTEVTLIPRIGFTILKVTLPFLVDPAKPDAARDLALQHARSQGIDVSDYEAA